MLARARTPTATPRKAREGLKAASPVVYTSVRLRTQGWGLKTNV